METKQLIPVIAAIALLSVGLVAAYGGFGAAMTDEERTAVQTAVENNDYNSWKTAMESQLTEEKFNQMQQRHSEMRQHREAVEAALDAGDYDAWVAAMSDKSGNSKATEFVTEDNFATFVKMHEARQSGDFETAEALAEELGMPEGCGGMKLDGTVGPGKGQGRGMHGGF